MRDKLNQALLAKERTEARLRHHLVEANQASEEQRQREVQFAEQNIPLTQRIQELEAQLGEQELCEADIRRDLEAAHASLDVVRSELQQTTQAQEAQTKELERLGLESASSASGILEARSA